MQMWVSCGVTNGSSGKYKIENSWWNNSRLISRSAQPRQRRWTLTPHGATFIFVTWESACHRSDFASLCFSPSWVVLERGVTLPFFLGTLALILFSEMSYVATSSFRGPLIASKQAKNPRLFCFRMQSNALYKNLKKLDPASLIWPSKTPTNKYVFHLILSKNMDKGHE